MCQILVCRFAIELKICISIIEYATRCIEWCKLAVVVDLKPQFFGSETIACLRDIEMCALAVGTTIAECLHRLSPPLAEYVVVGGSGSGSPIYLRSKIIEIASVDPSFNT